jgi:hypothetical protein
MHTAQAVSVHTTSADVGRLGITEIGDSVGKTRVIPAPDYEGFGVMHFCDASIVMLDR